jgi:hypothetical protein
VCLGWDCPAEARATEAHRFSVLHQFNDYHRVGLYGLGSMFWIYGMSRQKLISVYPFTILSFMIVYLVGTLGLGERPTGLGIIGVVLILAALPRRETPRERRRFLMKVIGGRR